MYVPDCQAKIAELSAGQFLGEMGLLDKAPRSASAISLSDDTTLKVIDEENFTRCFSENPEEILFMLQQMSVRLRQISRDYNEACHTVSNVMEADRAGIEKSPSLKTESPRRWPDTKCREWKKRRQMLKYEKQSAIPLVK